MIARLLLLWILWVGVSLGQPRLNLVGDADMLSGRLRLTPARRQMAGAAWLVQKQHVADGFDVTFQFQITQRGGLGPGADGFALVLQNQGIDALAGPGSAGGFALGGGEHDPNSPGIPNSIAVFFDTYRNGDGMDPSDNYVALCTNGPIRKMSWPPARLGVGKKLKVKLKDGRVHEARVRYRPPLLSVSLDDGEPEFRVPVDLRTILDERGDVFLGFTASTGNGYENHDILTWTFKPQVASDIFFVHSDIQYFPTTCMEGRNLCTPANAVIEETAVGRFHIILPAHLIWGASIPNPNGRPVKIENAQGLVCWDPQTEQGCGGASTALAQKTGQGKTWFSVKPQPGRVPDSNEGYFEFDAVLQ